MGLIELDSIELGLIELGLIDIKDDAGRALLTSRVMAAPIARTKPHR
jgi:hypothetical protein